MASDGGEIVLRVLRQALHRHDGKSRTYGSYRLTIVGVDRADGFVCEAHGPGDNDHEDCGRRILAGTYDLCTHFGSYRSVGWDPGRGEPLPCLAVGKLGKVGNRTNILVHPGHAWGLGLYLSSVGCLNLTGPLAPDQEMDAKDSFDRVVAVIEAIRAVSPGSFVANLPERLRGASIVLEDGPELAAC